jgi:adenosine deaminase
MRRTIGEHILPALIGAQFLAGFVCQAQTAPVERALDAAKADPAALRALLYRMPKGGDLHVHLDGAMYAESLIDDAAHGPFCINLSTLVFTNAKVHRSDDEHQTSCGTGTVPASDALNDQKLYDAMVNSLSMRSWVPTSGFSGHDQFFSTFPKFSAISAQHSGRWVDEVARRAAAQNEHYVELMYTPNFELAQSLAKSGTWTGDVLSSLKTLDTAALQSAISADRTELEDAETDRLRREQCGTNHPSPACQVKVRFLFQVLRAHSPIEVFTQALLGFEIAGSSPSVVGINFVQPEDWYAAMSQYDLEMKMIDQLHTLYPRARISLHAGELAAGMVPPDGLRFHIREAVEVGHAERIGHGVSLPFEDDAAGLLRELANRHVLVEINLTSNDVILGVKGSRHPLHMYRAAGVPVALSTDDEAVSRIDITNEYVRGVLEQNLTYSDLQTMARASLEHSFLPGESYWASVDDFDHPKAGCSGEKLLPSTACKALIDRSEKASAQYDLEMRIRSFEKEFSTPSSSQRH